MDDSIPVHVIKMPVGARSDESDCNRSGRLAKARSDAIRTSSPVIHGKLEKIPVPITKCPLGKASCGKNLLALWFIQVYIRRYPKNQSIIKE
jgi:hypothetical protein